MTFDDLIGRYPKTRFDSHGWTEVHSPFSLSAYDYLGFAESDLANERDAHSAVNALGNIKRSVDCRADSLLDFWGLYKILESRNSRLGDKLDVIIRVGVVAPSMLRRLNAYRNRAEHDYEIPSHDNLRDYYDLVELFIRYTDRFLTLDLSNLEVASDDSYIDETGRDIDSSHMHLKLGLERRTSSIKISGSDNWDKTQFSVSLKGRADFEEYVNCLRWCYAMFG